MKQNRSRLIALLLALCLLVGALPTLALADDTILTMDDYQNAKTRVEEALTAPDVPVEQTNQYYVARSSEVDSIVKNTVTGELSVDSAISFALPVAGRLVLRAPEAEAYRWQIRVGDQWANIVGDTEPEMTLTYAKLQNALSGNAAVVRCALTRAGETIHTAEATVTVDDKVETETTTVTEQIPVTSYYQPSAVSRAKELNAAVQANDEQSDTCSIVITYKFADGEQAANPWTATVAKGSSYSQTVTSPTVVGYAPDQATVEVNVTDIQEDKTYTVTYKPALVNYTVNHYQQNISDDKYTLAETEIKTDYTKKEVGDNLKKTYPGFTALLYDTTTEIAADGSTVVEIYYDRNYYLMTFDLDGGYGVEPIYARYGAPISVGAPTKSGYVFTGWTPSLPKTMPVNGGSYKAGWEVGKAVDYTVVFWYENADDTNYSYAGSVTGSAKAGTNVQSDDYKNASFDGRDTAHFTYNSAKAETVTVKGDGSTVLNVYYTRNTYTLKFIDGTERVLSCGKEEHKHTYSDREWYYYQYRYMGGCYPENSYSTTTICGKEEHSHDWWNCYSDQPKVVKEITAKYQADIHTNFPIKDGNKTIWWTVPRGCESFKSGTQLGSIDIMPGENIVFSKDSTQSGATIYYYVETLNGTAGEYSHDGKSFELYKAITTKKSGYLTYAEEFHDINGFTQWWSDPKFSSFDQNGKTSGINYNNYLCYIRNSYSLEFYNYNGYVDGKGGSVQYEAPLSGYNFTPDYPTELEPNAYKFAGWYTSPGCYDGSEVNWDTMTMPASDVTLYAKWAPKTHTVNIYKTDEMKATDKIGETQVVKHGEKATEPDVPKHPVSENYQFVGWFYKEGNVEKAFDFSMPVTKDLNLYAKWSSNTLVEYTIRYKLNDENGVEIAAETKGSALAGTTKTFDAKTGNDLNEPYNNGYFPLTSSHSLTMNIEGGNEFTFIYVQMAKVKYTVQYLEKGTNKVLHTEKTAETSNAVITEKFEPVTSYAPDAYQKRLVLSANEEENVLIFWYVADAEHAPVQIIHWTQNIAGNGYTEYQSTTNLNGVIGQEYSETPLTIDGFEYKASPVYPVEGYPALASGTLTKAGLVLNLYYDRIEYPYEFRFLEQGTDKELAEPATGNARYQAQVTQGAKDIPGYTLVSSKDPEEIIIVIEDPENTASKNVRTFYYTENQATISYVAIGPDGRETTTAGSVVPTSENVKVITGKAAGSTPTAASGFKFVGWYKDADCTQPVDGTWVGTDNKLTPGKTVKYGDKDGYASATYYAKFEYDVADLTITKQGCQDIDENQSFIFKVTGPGITGALKVVIEGNKSVTIKGLKVGEYTVTEVTDWSWRYTSGKPEDKESITLRPTQKNEVTFTNTRSKTKWLGGDAYSKNEFKTSANASTN